MPIVCCVYIAIVSFPRTNFSNCSECKHNKLLCGVRISSIEVSRLKLHISTSCMSTTKLIVKKSIQDDSFLRAKGFRMIPGKHGCLCSLLPYLLPPPSLQNRNRSKGQEETVHETSCDCQPLKYIYSALFAPANQK